MRRFIQRPILGADGTVRQPAIITFTGAQARFKLVGQPAIVPFQASPIILPEIEARDDYILEIRTVVGGAITSTDDVTIGVLVGYLGDDQMARRTQALANDAAAANAGYIAMPARAGTQWVGNEAAFYTAPATAYSWNGTAWVACEGGATRAAARQLQASIPGAPPVGLINCAASGSAIQAAAAAGGTPLAYWLGKGVANTSYEAMLTRIATAGGGLPEICEWMGLCRELDVTTDPAVFELACRRLFRTLQLDMPATKFMLADTPPPRRDANQVVLRQRHAALSAAQRRAALTFPRMRAGCGTSDATQFDLRYRTRPGDALIAARAAESIGSTYLPQVSSPLPPLVIDLQPDGTDQHVALWNLIQSKFDIQLGPGLMLTSQMLWLLPNRNIKGVLGSGPRLEAAKLTEIRGTDPMIAQSGSNRAAGTLITAGDFVAEGGYGQKLPYRPGPMPWASVRAALKPFVENPAGNKLYFETTAGFNKVMAERARLGVDVAFVWRNAVWHHGFNKLRPLFGTVVRILSTGVDGGGSFAVTEFSPGFPASDAWMGIASDAYPATLPKMPGTTTTFPHFISYDASVKDLILRNNQREGTCAGLTGTYNVEFDNIEFHGVGILGGNSMTRSKLTNFTGTYADRPSDFGYASCENDITDWNSTFVEKFQRNPTTGLDDPTKPVNERFQPMFQISESSRRNRLRRLDFTCKTGGAAPDYDRSEGFRLNHVTEHSIGDAIFRSFPGQPGFRPRRGLIDEKDHTPEDFICLYPLVSNFNPIPYIRAGSTSGPQQNVDNVESTTTPSGFPAGTDMKIDGSSSHPAQYVRLAKWFRTGSTAETTFRNAAGNGVSVFDSNGREAKIVHYVNATYTPGAIANERDAFYNALDLLWAPVKPPSQPNNFYTYPYNAVTAQSGGTQKLKDLVTLGGGQVLFGVGFAQPSPGAWPIGTTFTVPVLFPGITFTASNAINRQDQPVPGAPATPGGPNTYGNVWGTELDYPNNPPQVLSLP